MKNLYLSLFFALICSSSSRAQIISTFAGNGTAAFTGDGGAPTAASLNYTGQIAIDPAGNVYFAELNNHCIRKVSTSGVITTVAGMGIAGFSGDGGLATAAKLHTPYAVALDAAGNLYISDFANQRIRKVTTAGIISTIAGTGVGGYSGDGGPATSAQLWSPAFMFVDNSGNILFCDNQNKRVRKINTAGIITTIAGTGAIGYTGDGGPATAATLNFPNGVFEDAAGNIYIGDADNNAIRKINTSGIISTVAGNGSIGSGGDGGLATAATLHTPQGIYIDASGNIYFADTYNYKVRKINSTGIISTVAGTGVAGYSGDGGLATAAQLNIPSSVYLDNVGRLYISDGPNNRVRRIGAAVAANNPPSFTAGASYALNICSGEIPTSVDLILAVSDLDVAQTLTWSLITPSVHGTALTAYTATSTGGTVTPTGTTYTPFGGYTGTDMFQVRVTDGIASDTITVNVTVIGLPFAGAITSSMDSVCPGYTDALAESVSGGVWSTGSTAIATVSATGVVTGVAHGTATITYSVTNMCGTANTTFPVLVGGTPFAGTITSNLDSVCPGHHDTLSASVAGGTWSTGSTAIATVSATGVVTGVAVGTAIITYSVTNACGTANTTYPVAVHNSKLCVSGISNTTASPTFGISPNPSNGTFTITIPSTTEGKAHIVITNILGQRLKEYSINTNTPTEIAADLAPGIYLLDAVTGTARWSEKIVIIGN